MSIIEIKDVVKAYTQGGEEIYALNHLSLDVEEGEFLVVLGPSGSGKSTLLNMLGGLDSPTSGSVIVDGCNIGEYSERKMAEYRREVIGFVFQSYNLLPVLTVRENIEMPFLIAEKKIDKEFLQELMENLEIAGLEKRLPGQISGGQQQRVAIARALANNPRIILADEPTGNLDSDISQKVMELLCAISKKYHKTIIMITHNEELAKMADRVIRLKNGNIA